MRSTDLIRQTLLWLRYRNAAFVNSRDELEAAIYRAPPRIVVDGDEVLRAYAASIAVPQLGSGHFPPSAAPLAVPPVGRIRDGYKRRSEGAKPARTPLKGSYNLVLLVLTGTAAGLLAEWISYITPWPSPAGPLPANLHPRATEANSVALLWGARLGSLVLGAVALACFGRMAWLALSLGIPHRTEWRVEYRVPGRLVMVRVRQRVSAP